MIHLPERAAERARRRDLQRLVDLMKEKIEADDLDGAETLLPELERLAEEGVKAASRVDDEWRLFLQSLRHPGTPS